MKDTLLKMKSLFAGKWAGEGFAKFPTIDDTAYTEQLEFIPDEYKDVIFFRQKTWYKNHTEKNGHTVFWDTGFIILKEDKILLYSVQVGGRMETYELVQAENETFTFNSAAILNDPRSIRSQRVFTVNANSFHYELNMATYATDFQNHLLADLERAEF
ncbi:FABP family protein [Chitinophaga sp. GbtcB8]|uniref:FABP family protein n=1 Tax=Chitinophaga sp. GbtcB8 TaxID=2824753 RepID=UPI001C30160C|nr:FABP family protein [Chitinophaga sp. GbtcB8]